MPMNQHPGVTVIYDGECRFCLASLGWLQEKVEFTSIPYQQADLLKYDLTRAQCEQSVFVVTASGNSSGAAAIALLLRLRGNRLLAWAIRISGPLGRAGYRWVASHRGSRLIGLATKFLEWAINR